MEFSTQTPEFTRRLLAKEAKSLSQLDFAILLKDRFEGLYWSKNPRRHPALVQELDARQAIYLALRQAD